MVNKFLKLFCFMVMGFSICTKAQYGSTAPTLQDVYGKKNGSLRFSKTTLNMGVVENNEIRTDTVFIYNAGNSPLTLSVSSKPLVYLQSSLSAPTIAPSGKAFLTIKYDAAKKNDFGFVLDRIQLTTNDAEQPQKYITITANIQEYFTSQEKEDTVKMMISIPELSFDYGSLKQGEKAAHDFKIINQGVKKVILHKTKTNCGCLKAQLTKKELMPGDTAFVHVEFDSFGKDGKDSRTLSVFMHDPHRPEIFLEMKGEVKK